jgi:hypothetical protein
LSFPILLKIFSKSIAKGIRFYRDHIQNEELKDSIETEKFTTILNSVFDALNRKSAAADGIRKGST